MKKMNKRGFTIVELTIVIAVIAILSAVLIPTFSSIVRNSKNTAAIQEAQGAYTEYLSEIDYANGEDPAEHMIYKADNNKFIVFENGNMKLDGEVPYATENEAIEALGYTLNPADYEKTTDGSWIILTEKV